MNHDSQTIKVFLGKDLALTRQYNCIAKYEKDKNEKKTAENAAIKIQSVQRGRKGRREAAEIKKKWEEGLEQEKEGKAELIKHSFEVKKNLLIDLLKKYESNKETSGITLNNIDDDEGLNKIVNNLILMDPRNYKYDFLRKIHKEYIENLKKSKDEEEDEDDEEESEEEDEAEESDEEESDEEESEEEKKFNEGESQEKREKELEHTVDNNCYCQVKPSLDKASNYKSHEEFCKDLNKTSECSRQPNCIPLIGKLILYYKEIDPYKAEKSVATYNKQINFLKNNMSKIVDKIDFQQSWETELLKEIKKFVEAIKLWETETYITRVYDGKELHYKVINKNCPEVEIKEAEKEECFVKYILFKYRGKKFVKTGTNKYNLSRLKGAIQQGVEYKKADNKIEEKIEELLKSKESEKKSIATNTDPIEQAKEVVTPVVDDAELKQLQTELEETKEELKKQIKKSQDKENLNNEEIKKLKDQQQQELQKKLDEQSEKYEKELQERAKEAETEKGELEQKKKEYEQKAKEAEKNATKSEQKIERLNKQIKNLSEEDVKKKAQLEAEKKKLEEEQAVVEERKKKSEEEQAVVEQRKKELHKEQIEIERLKSQHEQELKELKEERKKAEDREEEKRRKRMKEFMKHKGESLKEAIKKLKDDKGNFTNMSEIKIDALESYPTLNKKIKNFLVFKENELIKAHHAKMYSDNIKRNNEKLVETLKLVPGEPFLGIEGLLIGGFGSTTEKKEEEKKEEEIILKVVKEKVRKFIMSKAEYIFVPSQHEQLSVKEYLKTL